MTHFAAMAIFVWILVVISFLTYAKCDPIPNTDGTPSVFSKAADTVKTAYHKAADHCVCVNHNCGCCSHLSEPSIHLDSTICANATYLDKDYGFSLTVTVDTHTVFNETMSLRNPPPICIGAPWVKDYADVCIRMYDIQAQATHLHGCFDVEALFKHIRVAKFDLGCFNMRGWRTKMVNVDSHSANNLPFVMVTIAVVIGASLVVVGFIMFLRRKNFNPLAFRFLLSEMHNRSEKYETFVPT